MKTCDINEQVKITPETYIRYIFMHFNGVGLCIYLLYSYYLELIYTYI